MEVAERADSNLPFLEKREQWEVSERLIKWKVGQQIKKRKNKIKKKWGQEKQEILFFSSTVQHSLVFLQYPTATDQIYSVLPLFRDFEDKRTNAHASNVLLSWLSAKGRSFSCLHQYKPGVTIVT